MVEPEKPCRQCREGNHRLCEKPKPVITLLSYQKVDRRRKHHPEGVTETLACCDEREFWTKQVYS